MDSTGPPLQRAEWAQVLRLLDTALDLPAADRAVWLHALVLEPPHLKAALQRLLHDREALETADFLGAGAAPVESGATGIQTLGPWRLLRPLGEGGMASVWLAERADGAHRRQVALKLPHLGLVAPGPRAQAFRQRFDRERQILSALGHPHIAQVLDAGTEGAQPWLAMEYIDGAPITTWAQQRSLGVAARLRLFVQVLQAVQHAHAQLVIHRDLKPSNVLVDAQGQAKLLDFGVAQLLDPGSVPTAPDQATVADLTRLGGRAMTLAYASPEQVAGGPLGTASDVYAAGVLLFELLTGRLPYEPGRDSPAALEEAIVQGRVRRPSQAAADAGDAATARALRGDLDTLLLKALHIQPGQRYASADALAQDIQRHLQRRPIHARPPSARYRLGRWARRHALGLAAGSTAVLALCIGLGSALWQAREARLQRDEALARQRVAEAVQAFAGDLLGMAGPDGRPLSVEQVVDQAEAVARALYASQPEVLAELLMLVARKNIALQRPAARQRAAADALALAARTGNAPLHALAACRAVPLDVADAADRVAVLTANLPATPAFARARYNCHSYLATLLTWSGQSTQAQHHAELSEVALTELAPMAPVLQAEVLETRADIARGRGRADEADAWYARAVQAQRDSGRGATLSTALLLNYRVLMLVALGRPAQALAQAEAMAALLAGMGAPEAMPAYMHTNTGAALLELGRWDDAERAFRRAMQRAQVTGATAFLLGAQGKLAELHLERGEVPAARALIQARSALEARSGSSGPVGSAALLRARLAHAEGRNAEARAVLDEALPGLAANPFVRATELQAWLLRAEVALADVEQGAAGERAAAQRAAREALAVAARLGPGPSARAGRARVLLARALQADDALAARTEATEAASELEATLGPDHAWTRAARALRAP